MTLPRRRAAVLAALSLLTGAACAAPVVSDVRLVQRSDSRTVDIYYRLTGDNAYITLVIDKSL